MKKKKLLIFNLGGALLMPTDEVIGVWCDAIRSVGLIPDYSKIYLNYEKSYADVVIPDMAAERGWTQLQLDAIFAKAKKIFHDINTNNNLELPNKIKELRSRGYSLGVITDKNRTSLVRGLNKIGCTIDLFDFISTSDDGFKKPDSRVLSKMLEKYKPKEMLIIGQDYHREFLMAEKVGIDFAAITSPTYPTSFWESMMGNLPEKNIYNLVPDFIDDFLK